MTAMRNNRSGSSFVEMLMVLAIAGILAALSYGYMIAAKPHAELEAAEIQLVSHLSLARKHAMSEELTTRVILDGANNQFYTEYQDEGGSWHLVNWVETLKGNVVFATGGITLAGSEARFTPRGTLHWGGSITLQASSGETSTLTANIATGKFPLTGGNLR